MGYRKFNADKLFDGYRLYSDEYVLVTEDNGQIVSVISKSEADDDIQYYKGILSPGFINCHCHLELSHLKNVIPPDTGLVNFLKSVVQKRGFAADLIQEKIQEADKEMYDNGVVAVGDISNQTDTIHSK